MAWEFGYYRGSGDASDTVLHRSPGGVVGVVAVVNPEHDPEWVAAACREKADREAKAKRDVEARRRRNEGRRVQRVPRLRGEREPCLRAKFLEKTAREELRGGLELAGDRAWQLWFDDGAVTISCRNLDEVESEIAGELAARGKVKALTT